MGADDVSTAAAPLAVPRVRFDHFRRRIGQPTLTPTFADSQSRDIAAASGENPPAVRACQSRHADTALSFASVRSSETDRPMGSVTPATGQARLAEVGCEHGFASPACGICFQFRSARGFTMMCELKQLRRRRRFAIGRFPGRTHHRPFSVLQCRCLAVPTESESV